MRERYLLAGLLISWYFLYNETPPDSSWIWDWYPDGTEWRQAVNDDGERGVRQTLLKYSDMKSEVSAVPERMSAASLVQI